MELLTLTTEVVGSNLVLASSVSCKYYCPRVFQVQRLPAARIVMDVFTARKLVCQLKCCWNFQEKLSANVYGKLHSTGAIIVSKEQGAYSLTS